MKPVLIAAAAIAIVAAVAVLTGRFRDHAYSPAELAEEDEAQARWAGLVAESKGRVPVTCDGCGDWRYADELTDRTCNECRFATELRDLLDNGGAS